MSHLILVPGWDEFDDERCYEVPVSVVCTEFTGAMLREWVNGGMKPVQELARIRDVEYIDLTTGHWPQITRPTDLADIVLQRAPTAGGRS